MGPKMFCLIIFGLEFENYIVYFGIFGLEFRKTIVVFEIMTLELA